MGSQLLEFAHHLLVRSDDFFGHRFASFAMHSDRKVVDKDVDVPGDHNALLYAPRHTSEDSFELAGSEWRTSRDAS